jgi:heme-degrading monooxygenase HmoA
MESQLVVIFRSRLREGAGGLKSELNAMVEERVPEHPGLIRHKSFTNDDGETVTIVEFADEASWMAWAADDAHVAAKRRREELYETYEITIAQLIGPSRVWRSDEA